MIWWVEYEAATGRIVRVRSATKRQEVPEATAPADAALRVDGPVDDRVYQVSDGALVPKEG